MASAEWTSLAIGAGAILLLLGTWVFSFLYHCPSDARLEGAMEELAGGNLPSWLRPITAVRPRNSLTTRCPVRN